jgi:plasmid stability protein
MIRTQLQLDDASYNALREMAHKQHKSMSAVAREIFHAHLAAKKPIKVSSFTFIGSGASVGRHDISVHHDEALEEDFR